LESTRGQPEFAYQADERFQSISHVSGFDLHRHEFHFQTFCHRHRESAFIEGFFLKTQRIGFQWALRVQ
jgi:hypothetical protein